MPSSITAWISRTVGRIQPDREEALITGRKDIAPLAVTMGEPAGIGPDIILEAWRHRTHLPAFYAIALSDVLIDRARRLGLDVPVRTISAPGEAATVFGEALPVLPLEEGPVVAPGTPDIAAGHSVTAAIERAVEDALSGAAAGVVTAPIHKDVLASGGFAFPGHTEYLADLCRQRAKTASYVRGPVMMLVAGDFRVVPLTVHIPLRAVPDALSTQDITEKGRIVAAALQRDFGVARPRLVMAGLNPHAGESGRIGEEEETILTPAVDRLRAEGIEIQGPLSADTLFHAEARTRYDAALCMYHDQALIPLKTVDFWGGVNITLGLPIVRTSPDHGTAFDLAGTSRADATSMMAALRAAADMARRRGARADTAS